MDHHDMTGDGVKDLIVAREGGAIQVYSYEDGDEAEPTMRFSHVGLKILFKIVAKLSIRSSVN